MLREYTPPPAPTEYLHYSTIQNSNILAAIASAYNPEHHGKLKHVERRHFYIREAIEAHRLCLRPFRTRVRSDALCRLLHEAVPVIHEHRRQT